MRSVAPECEDPMKRACIVGSKSPGFINHKHGRGRPKHLSVPKPIHLAKTSHDSCHPGIEARIEAKRREVTHTGLEGGLGDSCQRLRARGHTGERRHGKWQKPLRYFPTLRAEADSISEVSSQGQPPVAGFSESGMERCPPTDTLKKSCDLSPTLLSKLE